MPTIQLTVLIAAAVMSGLIAGLYYAFSCAVMPGLRRVPDSAFVESMRSINLAILNPWFALVFAGGPLATVVALVLGPTVPLAAALAFHGVALVVTFRINVPLNERLDDTTADGPELRAAFEGHWVGWNLVRAICCTVALLALCIELAR